MSNAISYFTNLFFVYSNINVFRIFAKKQNTISESLKYINNFTGRIVTTRKSAEYLRTIYGNTGQLFRPYYIL